MRAGVRNAGAPDVKTYRVIPFQGSVQLYASGYLDEGHAIRQSQRMFQELQEYLDDSRAWYKVAQVTQDQETICSACKRKWETMMVDGVAVCSWCEAPEKEG